MDYHDFVFPEPGKTQHRSQLGDGYLECPAYQKCYPLRGDMPVLFATNGSKVVHELVKNGKSRSLPNPLFPEI